LSLSEIFLIKSNAELVLHLQILKEFQFYLVFFLILKLTSIYFFFNGWDNK